MTKGNTRGGGSRNPVARELADKRNAPRVVPDTHKADSEEARVLEQLKEWLDDPKGTWNTGHYALDRDGMPLALGESPRAVCWCVMGRIDYLAPDNLALRVRVEGRIRAAGEPWFASRPQPCNRSVALLNDVGGLDVIRDAVGKALEQARAEAVA